VWTGEFASASCVITITSDDIGKNTNFKFYSFLKTWPFQQALVQSNRNTTNNTNNNNTINTINNDESLGNSVGPEGVADLRRELAESQIHANRVQKQFDIFKTRAADDAKRNQQRIVALEGDVKRKASALEILQQSVESYGQQQQPAAAATSAASSSSTTIDAEVAPLRAELAKVRATLERAVGERDSVRVELQSTIDELNRARTSVHRDAALEQQLARARVDSGELQRLRVQCEQLEALLGVRDNELTAARDEAGLLAQLRTKYDAVFDELTAAKSALASAQVRLDHQQQQLREQQQSQQQLLRAGSSGEAGAATTTTSELRSELATAREQLSEARAAEREASAQCAALRQQVEAHQASLQRLASQSERERKAIRLAHIRATKLQIDELKTIVQTQLLFENRLVSVL
jgi:chromosome segregation ATPase